MKRFILGTLVLTLCLTVSAQQPQKLPIDSAVRVGHLDNGLTYYIRHNEYPKQRCEFHIAQAVGAILEEDHQNGLAHFLEHMAFNGTEHFPGKGIINYFESVGVNFGGNINAYTSLDETVYRLSDVPTTRMGIVDSALLVMHDWACGLSLLPEEIDAERGVIREEWRTGADANRRMWKQSNALMYPGSQYAKRDVIGDTAVINNFAYDALRDYYKKWYGPDNQAVIVVGDINVDTIEAKIKALWADVPARVNRGERPVYSVDNNAEPIVSVVTDGEAQITRITVIFKKDPLPESIKGTDMDYVLSIAHTLVTDMIDNRMSDLALDPNASFVAGGTDYGELVKAKDALYAVYIPKVGQEKQAYADLLYQLEKVRRYGFTNAELERVKAEMLSMYEKFYNERNSTRNIGYVQECKRNFLDGEVMPGIEWEYDAVKQILPSLTITEINRIAKPLITDENVIVSITAPTNAQLPTEEEIRSGLKNMSSLPIEAPEEETIRTTLVEKTPKAGRIKKVAHNDVLGTTEWTLSNGVRIILKPTDFKQDEILFSASSFGGTSLITNPADLPSAIMATDVVEFCGLADFSNTDLSKALAGKHVNISPSINTLSESMSGSSTVKDLETLLQLNYLYFTSPRRDEKAFQTFISLMETSLANKNQDPKSIWYDSINVMASNYSPRTIVWTKEKLQEIDLDRALAVYKARFANPADFIFTFTGCINPDDKDFQKLVCTWLGGMKTNKTRENFTDNGVRAPQGTQKNYFAQSMQTRTASDYIQYTSYDIPYTMDNMLNVNMIGRILSTRYLESIREREGGSYGVGVAGRLHRNPVAEAELFMIFDTDPEKQEVLINIIHEEVQTILDNGPLATDLSKEKESMLKDYGENMEKNNYWSSLILPQYYLYGYNYVTSYESAVRAITSETVQQMLKNLVASGNMFEVVMLPE